MFEEIVEGISCKLNAIFGTGYQIYSDEVKQGLQEPCFSIELLQPQRVSLLSSRYKQTAPFDISYFPKTDGDSSELLGVADKLLDQMEIITLSNGDMLRGMDMSTQTVDGVLHFHIIYNLILRKAEAAAEPMKAAEINVKTR